MKAVLGYALVSAALLAAIVAAVTFGLEADGAHAVWRIAVVTCLVQSVLFATLLAVRGRQRAFFVAWGGGTLARIGLVAVVGVWVARSGIPPLAPLLSLAAFLFVMLLLEPFFFRAGLRRLWSDN